MLAAQNARIGTHALAVAACLLCAASTICARATENAFDATILIADRPEFNPTVMVDPHLLNPWGIALRPPGAGGHIWISNAGDGTIAAYDLASGAFVGNLHDAGDNDISIEGLWGLTFGNGVSLGDANSLYFTAGPSNEFEGMFGRLTVVPQPASVLLAAWGGALLLAGLKLWQRRLFGAQEHREARDLAQTDDDFHYFCCLRSCLPFPRIESASATLP